MADTFSPTQPRVTLFVVPDCPLCMRARDWLAGHNIRYQERDVAGDFGALRAMYRLTGQRLVPVFAIDDRALVRPTGEQLTDFLSSTPSTGAER
ncbi:MAG: glutaredoxin family protein [Acidobacteriota bacterium]|nr:glutaredoxin family protein [Acidobacteriota bacterium]